MERTLQFTEVRAAYKGEGLLAGPHSTAFEAEISVPVRCKEKELPVKFGIEVNQGAYRQITVTAKEPVYWTSLLIPLYELERMFAIFDGSFVPIADIHFVCPDCPAMATEDDCAEMGEQALKERLRLYTSSNWSRSVRGLVNFQDVLTHALFERWHDLLDELDIVNQVYLRVMHIKRNQEGKAVVNGKECVYYLMKLSLLYRVILLDLLGISMGVYSPKLKVATEAVDGWWMSWGLKRLGPVQCAQQRHVNRGWRVRGQVMVPQFKTPRVNTAFLHLAIGILAVSHAHPSMIRGSAPGLFRTA